ncbi:hypothetical protein AB0L57_32200 [Nocardia sp. NPDC052254]|uniref:hypothetical protein n=1 Tax=Nocardia sp. NPDC052254 TaxID=3155681 RepID=UPI00343EA3FC
MPRLHQLPATPKHRVDRIAAELGAPHDDAWYSNFESADDSIQYCRNAVKDRIETHQLPADRLQWMRSIDNELTQIYTLFEQTIAGEYETYGIKQYEKFKIPLLFGLASEDFVALNVLLDNIRSSSTEEIADISELMRFRIWRQDAYRTVQKSLYGVRAVFHILLHHDDTIDAILDAPLDRRVSARIRRIDEIASNAEQALENIREVSNEVSTTSLAGAFEAYAHDETRQTTFWSAAAILFLLCTICVTAAAVWPSSGSGSALQVELVKLSISLPLIAISAYCARISNHHRANARHASLLAVQLKTVRSYCDVLQADAAAEIQLALGRRIFAKPDFGIHPSQSEDAVNVLPSDVTHLLEKAIEALSKKNSA